MTKVIMPLLSQDARGSVAGVQYSKNTYGNFASRKSTSNRKDSLTAGDHRRQLGRAHHLWDAASPAQRATWDHLATPGRTARSHFIAGFLRMHSLSVFINVADGAGDGPNSLTGLIFTVLDAATGQSKLEWTADGPVLNFVSCSVAASWGPRKGVHRRKYKWNFDGLILIGQLTITPVQRAPFYQFLYDVLDRLNGQVYQTFRFDVPIP